MLATERAGDGICELQVTNVLPPGDMAGAAGEYARLGTGEPRPEMVRHSTAEGVAATRKCWKTNNHNLNSNLHAAGLGTYNRLSTTLLRFFHRSIFCCSTGWSLILNSSSRLSTSISFLCCCFLTIAFISSVLIFLSFFHCVMRVRYCRSLCACSCKHAGDTPCIT